MTIALFFVVKGECLYIAFFLAQMLLQIQTSLHHLYALIPLEYVSRLTTKFFAIVNIISRVKKTPHIYPFPEADTYMRQ